MADKPTKPPTSRKRRPALVKEPPTPTENTAPHKKRRLIIPLAAEITEHPHNGARKYAPLRDARTGNLVTRSPQKRARALAALAKYPTLAAGARAAGIDRATLARWIDDEPEFRAEVEAAIQTAVDRLEEHAFRRAQGDDGKSPSDLLTIFLMKGHRHQYRDRIEHQHTGAISHEIVIDLIPAGANSPALAAGAEIIDAETIEPAEKWPAGPRTAPAADRLPDTTTGRPSDPSPADTIDAEPD